MRLQRVTVGRPERPGRERPGAAVVEFAVIAPVLVFLTLGMIETSRGFMGKEILDDAARVACRLGSYPTATSADMEAKARQIIKDHGLDDAKASVTIYVNDAQAGANTAKQNDKISVQITIPASALAWTGNIFLAGRNVESRKYSMLRHR